MAPMLVAQENSPDGTPKEFKFAYKMKLGDIVRYEVRHDSTMITQAAQVVDKLRNRSNELKHFRVADIDKDGNATLVCVLDHVRMSAQFNDSEPLLFASDWSRDRVPEKYLIVWQSIGKPLARMTVAPNGKLLDLQLLEHEQYKKPSPSPLAPPESTLDFDQVNFLVEFPDKPVAIGETWSKRITVKVQLDRKLTRNINLLRTYKLDSVKDDVARIKTMTSIIGRISDPRIQVQLLQREPRGIIEFDAKRGILLSRKVSMDQQLLEPFGMKSSVSSKTTRSEQFVEPDSQVARKPD
ncbi:MAG: DUF6263 family protein [Planctomycetota bacterium]|nr:DUF6263 family protein [Planctomycetota bacterium]